MTKALSCMITPRITPVMDPFFRPAVLARRRYCQWAKESGAALPVTLALEQADGSISHHDTVIFKEDHPASTGNFGHIERLTKFLLWSRGGFRVYLSGTRNLALKLAQYF